MCDAVVTKKTFCEMIEAPFGRGDAIDTCSSLGKLFIEHFPKIYSEGIEGKDFPHHCAEMQAWLDKCRAMRLRGSNRHLTQIEQIDWFFTACGAIDEENGFITEDEADAYNRFVILLAGNPISVKDAAERVLTGPVVGQPKIARMSNFYSNHYLSVPIYKHKSLPIVETGEFDFYRCIPFQDSFYGKTVSELHAGNLRMSNGRYSKLFPGEKLSYWASDSKTARAEVKKHGANNNLLTFSLMMTQRHRSQHYQRSESY